MKFRQAKNYMRYLLLGSSGFIGRATQAACVACGDDVFGLSRRADAANHPDCHNLIGDRDDITGVLNIVRQFRIDCIIDFRAMSLETTAPLITALAERGLRYVLISSSDVYRNYGLLHKLEIGEADGDILIETSLLRCVLYPYRTEFTKDPASPDHWKHRYDKIPIEQFLMNYHPNWTILRAPMVYGAGDKTGRTQWVKQKGAFNFAKSPTAFLKYPRCVVKC
jgi:nucleoside-diphosphate-sugar epimerase